MMSHDLFISYSTMDKPTADAVCAALERAGIRCWMAPRDILPGRIWGEAIIDAIRHSSLMVVVFSSSSNASAQVLREIERAVSKGIAILPFRIENVEPSGSMEYFLATPHWLDAITPPLDRHIQSMVRTVELLLAQEPVGVKRAVPSPPVAEGVEEIPPDDWYESRGRLGRLFKKLLQDR